MVLTSLLLLGLLQDPPVIKMPTTHTPQVIHGLLSVNMPAKGETHLLYHPVAEHDFPLDVPPGVKVKAQLKAAPRMMAVRFVADGLAKDTGLLVNDLHGRPDAQFYENRGTTTRRIWCVVYSLMMGLKDEPYELTFSDF